MLGLGTEEKAGSSGQASRVARKFSGPAPVPRNDPAEKEAESPSPMDQGEGRSQLGSLLEVRKRVGDEKVADRSASCLMT